MKKLLLLCLLSLPAFAQSNFLTTNPALAAQGTTCLPTNCLIMQLPPGTQSVGVTIKGTFSATLNFEESTDQTATIISANAFPQPSGASVNSATAAGTWVIATAGMTHVQVRMSAFSSGGATVSLSASPSAAGIPQSTSTTPLQATLAGISNANPLPVSLAASASAPVTFRAATVFTPAATAATDIFTLTGSATKTCDVTHIQISCTATAAVASDVILLKRSTADTAGTSSPVTAVPLDSNSAAGTCTVLAYTANPTTGSLVGNVSIDKSAISTATGAPQALIDDFGIRQTQPLILRGVAQVAAVNLNGATLAGLSCDIEVEWTEQ